MARLSVGCCGAEYSGLRDSMLYFWISAGHRTIPPGPSSSGNFASNSASQIPSAPAVALFAAPNAIIARTKRWSAARKFEASLLSSAASAFLSAARRDVIAFRFRPDPGLAPPRPIPLDFVISNPLNFWRSSGPLSSKGQEQPSHCREIGLALAGVGAPRPCGPVPLSRRDALQFDLSPGDTITNSSRPGQDTSRKRERESLSNR